MILGFSFEKNNILCNIFFQRNRAAQQYSMVSQAD